MNEYGSSYLRTHLFHDFEKASPSQIIKPTYINKQIKTKIQMGFLSELELLIKYISLNKEISFIFLFAFFFCGKKKESLQSKSGVSKGGE
jgi:hypothetical protein